jgi:hypothetical protein
MFQAGITVAIIVGSFILLGYWFRYTCLLLLSTRTARDYASSFAEAHQLTFLAASLDRDFDSFSRWNANLGIEERMLQLDYRLKRLFVRLTGSIAPAIAKEVLGEMTMVASHLANSLGERACAGQSAA